MPVTTPVFGAQKEKKSSDRFFVTFLLVFSKSCKISSSLSSSSPPSVCLRRLDGSIRKKTGVLTDFFCDIKKDPSKYLQKTNLLHKRDRSSICLTGFVIFIVFIVFTCGDSRQVK